MIDQPQIIETERQLIAILALKIPKNEMMTAMGPGLAELKAAVAAQGISITGAWLTHHLKITPAAFDFEICVPVARAIVASGRIQPSEWPAQRVARTVLHGNYSGLGSAWGEFGKWIADKGYEAAPDLWERYLVGPDTHSNPDDWRTELSRPLVG